MADTDINTTPLNTAEDEIRPLIDFINNPRFYPTRQDKYFITDAMSYYEALLRMNKVLAVYSQTFEDVWANEQSIVEGTISTEVLEDALDSLRSDLEAEIDAVEQQESTHYASLSALIAGHTADISAINASLATMASAISAKLSRVNMTGQGITFVDGGIVDGVQTINASVSAGPGVTLNDNLAYLNASDDDILSEIVVDKQSDLDWNLMISRIGNGIKETNIYDLIGFASNDFTLDEDDNIALMTPPVGNADNNGHNVAISFQSQSDGTRSISADATVTASAVQTTGGSNVQTDLNSKADKFNGFMQWENGAETYHVQLRRSGTNYGEISFVRTKLSDSSQVFTQLYNSSGDFVLLDGVKSDIADLDDSIDRWASRVSVLEGKMNTAESNITTLQSDLDSAESDIADLDTQVFDHHTKLNGTYRTICDMSVVTLTSSASVANESTATVTGTYTRHNKTAVVYCIPLACNYGYVTTRPTSTGTSTTITAVARNVSGASHTLSVNVLVMQLTANINQL